jgi:hypothetical protein
VLTAPARLAMKGLAWARGERSSDRVDAALDRLSSMGTHVLLLFSDREPLYEELRDSGHLSRLDRWPNLTLEQVTGYDHPLRPLIAQRQAHEALDRALARDLDHLRGGHDSRPGAIAQDRAA